MPGNGNRSGGLAVRAPEGRSAGGQGLPAGVRLVDSWGTRDYSFSVGGKPITLSVDSGGHVGFDVSGSYSRGELQGRDAVRATRMIMRVFEHDVSTRPNGYKYQTDAFVGDGYGSKRAAAYQKAGFSEPLGDRAGGQQYGIVKNGRLVPDTKSLRNPSPLDQMLSGLI